ncbi:putative reverse transcriptase domain-containing protein [Tanacetum coccineum]
MLHPLPPLPPSLYIPPPVDHRDDILKSEQPPRKRLCLSTLGYRYKVGESSTARPTRGRGIDYGFVSTVDVEDRVTELVELHDHDTQDLYALLEEAQDSRSLISQQVDMDSQRAHSIGLRQATHQELQTYHDHVYAHETPLQAHQTQLQLQSTLIQTQHQMIETLQVIRDMRREMSDMQAELLTLREQQRKAIQPGPDAKILDHQDASGDTNSHIHNGNGSHSSHRDNRRNVQTVRPCFYADFMKCQPLNFKGTEGVVGLTRWIEKMESVFNISGCAIENQVKFATWTLLGAALTWWNGQIRTLGPEAYARTWEILKKKMTDKYCPQGEIKKLEIELWNLKFVAKETEKVDKYISRLPDNIYGNVKSARPKTLDETIELANELMDQKLRTYIERQSDNKRKADDLLSH